VEEQEEFPKDDLGTTQLALAALASLERGRPMFLWVHYFGPHAPSEVHAQMGPLPRGIRSQYEYEAMYADLALGPLLAALDRLASTHDALVFLTADHGESFGITARFHGATLDEDAIRVPLIVKMPSLEGGRVSETVSLVDVVPTLLWELGTRDLGSCDGRPLQTARGRREPGAYVQTVGSVRDARGALGVVVGDAKLVMDTTTLAEWYSRVDVDGETYNPGNPASEREALLRFIEERPFPATEGR
jgi:arylsulfatase A-like enzyme